MSLVPGESEYRCLECSYAHRDQTAYYPHQIPARAVPMQDPREMEPVTLAGRADNVAEALPEAAAVAAPLNFDQSQEAEEENM